MNRLGRALARTVASVLLVGVLVVGAVALRTFQVSGWDQRDPADVIVVLGAAQYDGRPSPVFAARLDHAAQLYRDGVAGHIVTLGGGQEGDASTEGESGHDYLAAAGLPADSLISVGVGGDTLASLRAADPVLAERGWHDIVLVTDPAHANRARVMARDLGWRVQVSSVSTGPSVREDVQGRYFLRETLGTLYYLVTGASSGIGSTVL